MRGSLLFVLNVLRRYILKKCLIWIFLLEEDVVLGRMASPMKIVCLFTSSINFPIISILVMLIHF